MLHAKLAALEMRRANNGPLPSGIAPFTTSGLFKKEQDIHGPEPKSWDHRLSLESRQRSVSTLKAAASTRDPATIINLGTARPASEHSPWESMTVRGTDVYCQHEEPAEIHSARGGGDDAYSLGVAMNYGHAAGSPQLLRFVTEHVELVHDPPYRNWASCLTCGTTSALDIVFQMLCNKGDWVLAEAYTYSGAIEAAKGFGVSILGVPLDDYGLLPNDLDAKLSNWNPALGPKPFVLYTIPTGQNPTGVTQTLERRRAIYQVAERHDLCIIEDDPYYFLHLGDDMVTTTIAPDEYLTSIPPSYLSLDKSGRVLRLDATSKILGPGLRCGWITGPSQLIEKFLVHTEFSTVSPSGPSQLMLYKLLDETWGHEGFFRWLMRLSGQYRRRRDTLLQACTRWLPGDVCRWDVPAFGMFLWIRLDLSKHPGSGSLDDGQKGTRGGIEESIHARAQARGVQVGKGSWFAVDEKDLGVDSDLVFRLTFAAASEDALDRAVQLFASAVRDEFAVRVVDGVVVQV